MIPEYIKDRINLFQHEKYYLQEADSVIILEERKQDGHAVVQCSCNRDFLVLPTPEKNVLPYLDGSVKGRTKCADVFVFVYEEDGWELHIMEWKRTVNTSTFADGKEQFRLGIWNARAVAAFLGIEIKKTYLCVGFRTDAIKRIPPENLIAMRASNNFEAIKIIEEWKKGIVPLYTDAVSVNYPLRKIALDEDGLGELRLAVSA